MSKKENLIIGKMGENIANEYLKNKGYKILDTNFKCKIGEIDIIASINNLIVFVEVKTRSSDRYGLPGEAVNYYKQRKIQMVAMNYIKFKRLNNMSIRFDVIEVMNNEVNHLENCF